MARRRSALAAVVLAVVLSACDITLATERESWTGLCLRVRLGGRIVSDARSGLAIFTKGEVHPIIWPWKFMAKRDGDAIVLVNRDGDVVAREGDTVALTGGIARDGLFHLCGDQIEILVPRPT